MELEPETSIRLFEEGGTLVFLDVPVGTEVGIDLESWNTGEKFKGIKMIPPGMHFVHFSTVGRDGISQSPRTGFFHYFNKAELLCKKYDPKTEDISIEVSSSADIDIFKSNMKELDRFLGPYPYKIWKKWISLSGRISESCAKRLSPLSKRICSAPELVLDDKEDYDPKTPPSTYKRMTKLQVAESQLPKMSETEDSKIRYTQIPTKLFDADTPASQITKEHLDSSLKLEVVIQLCGSPEELLAELQFSFVCFLVAQNYNSFEHWKELIKLACYSYDAILKYPDFYSDFLSDLYFQMAEVESELFTDIVTENNFIYTCLKRLFSNIRESEGVKVELESKCKRFEKFCKGKFDWEFLDAEDEEDLPVVVTL